MIKVTSYDWGHEGLVNSIYDGSLVNGWISKKANSAGGVSVKFDVENYGTKPVQSYFIYFTPYNGAHEPVRCTVTNLCTKGVSCHDRLGPNGVRNNKLLENAWYNHSIRSVSIDRIDVTYTDGTKETCNGNYVPTKEEDSSSLKSGCLGDLFVLALIAMFIGCIWLMIKMVLN
jgi:hypothetical protein